MHPSINEILVWSSHIICSWTYGPFQSIQVLSYDATEREMRPYVHFYIYSWCKHFEQARTVNIMDLQNGQSLMSLGELKNRIADWILSHFLTQNDRQVQETSVKSN